MNHEPESFRLLPGAGGSPVILHVPHSSRAVPESVRGGIVLDDRELEQELDHITDSHTADIAAGWCGGGGGRRTERQRKKEKQTPT
ncbi:hypothetical protein ACFV0A_20165, partial [Streptomyces sp. NPDC059552]